MHKFDNVNASESIFATYPQNNYWLKNSIIALALAGVYSIILVFLRTPYINKLFFSTQIFRSALIVHVNLSVLVWLLSMLSNWWSRYLLLPQMPRILAMIAFFAMLIMVVSPLVGESTPILNNYIPMLENIYFIISLNLFGTSILILALCVVCHWLKNPSREIFAVFNITTALTYTFVWLCFILSYLKLQKIVAIVPIDLDFYYELLFWSGGHLLQFLYTQGLMWAWICLTLKQKKQKKFFNQLFILNFFLSLIAVPGHFFYEVIDAEFKQFYTLHMRYLGGIAPILCLSMILYECYHSKLKILSASFICSALLFVSGGVIGILISGMNLTIPAHYHGSIVGITIAFMGIAYQYIGIKQISSKTSVLSIYTITVGQILHIAGLAVAGGYGAMRKAPEIELSFKEKFAMGIMGGGGLIAIIGGLMFVYICVKKLYFEQENKYLDAYNT